MRGSDKGLARLAHGILKALSKEDDSWRVRYAAVSVLNDYEATKTTKADKWLDYGITGCHSMKVEFRQYTGGASVSFASYQQP